MPVQNQGLGPHSAWGQGPPAGGQGRLIGARGGRAEGPEGAAAEVQRGAQQ